MSSTIYEIYKGSNMEKKQFTEKELEIMSDRFRMLSERSRLKIVSALFDGELSVNGIVEATGLLQANVSKQLKLLTNHGIVECRPEGLMRYYRLVDFTIHKICSAVCSIEK